MNGMLTGFFGALVEAWAQLRIGKLRVLLSLVGVAAAVAAMTFVIALGQVSVTAINKVGEKYNGRQGTVTISVNPTGKGLSQVVQADDAPRGERGREHRQQHRWRRGRSGQRQLSGLRGLGRWCGQLGHEHHQRRHLREDLRGDDQLRRALRHQVLGDDLYLQRALLLPRRLTVRLHPDREPGLRAAAPQDRGPGALVHRAGRG